MPDNKDSQYGVVLMEQVDAKLDLVLESVGSLRSELIQRMDKKFAEQDTRFDGIESILHIHSKMLKDVDGRLTRVEKKVDKMDDRLTRVEGKLDQVDGRLVRVEDKLDDVCCIVKRHDTEIRDIRVGLNS